MLEYELNGTIYTEDEVNEAAGGKENANDFIKKNGLKPVNKGIIKPGKIQSVAKKDAVVTGKNTVSKSVKPSSVSQSNVWGEAKAFDPLNLNKFNKPVEKRTRLHTKEERESGEYEPNVGFGDFLSVTTYKKPKTSEMGLPKSIIDNKLKTKEGIKNEIELNDLDLKNPYLYYSNSKIGDDFVEKNYNSKRLKQLGIDPNDFDGFINKKKYKDDFIEKDQSGAFERNWLDKLEDYAPDWMGRSTQSEEEVKFKKERILNNYLNLYILDKSKRATLYTQLKQKEASPEKDWEYIKKVSKPVSAVDEFALSEYNGTMFPTLKKISDTAIVEGKKAREHLKTRSTPLAAVEETFGFAKNLVGSMWNTSKELIATAQDLVGLDKEADLSRDQAIYDVYKTPDTKDYGYIEGKSVEVKGVKYLEDREGNLYDVTHGFNMAGIIEDKEYKEIKAQIDSKGKDDWSVSPRGAAKNTAQVLGAMVPQLLLAEATAGMGGAIGTRALATRAGFSSVAEYKNMVALSEAVGGKALTKMPLPITKEMASSIVAQSAFGYSNGYEQTLKAAKNAGINDTQAESLALTAGNQMAMLYALTAPLSPQTKAKELIFGSAERRLVTTALNEFRDTGTRGFINTLNRGVKSAARGVVGFVEEGGKEAIQENIQQKGEQEVVNANINELAGQKILKDNYTYQDFINTSGLSFLSGGLIANAKIPNFSSDPNQQLINLYTLGQNPTLLTENLDALVKNGSATLDEAEKLKKEAFSTVQQLGKIPKNTDAATSLNLIRKLQEVEDLETSKKTIAKPFHGAIDEKIEIANNEITEIYNKSFETELEKLNKNVGVAKGLASTVGKTEFENPITNPDGTIDALVAFETQEEGQKALDDFNEKMGLPKSQLSNTVGTNLPNGQIIINKELAKKTRQTNVAGHELLHKILVSSFSTLSKNDLVKATELKDKFLSALSDEEYNAVIDRVLKEDKGERLYTDEYLQKNPDEYLTQFFEIVASKKLTWSDKLGDMFAKIGDILLPFLKEKGFDNLQFQDGKDVYDFIKDYNKNLRRGKLSKRAIELGDQGKTMSTPQTFSKVTVEEIKQKIEKLEDQFDNDDIDYDDYTSRLKTYKEDLKKAEAAPKVETTTKTEKPKTQKTETKETVIKSKANLQNLLDTKYNSDPKKMASEGLRYTPSGNATNDFAKSVIGKELGGAVETITRRLYDPIAADAKRGVSRDEYKNALLQSASLLINNEFDPSKQSLDKFISSRLNLRANALAYELGIEGATKGGIKKDVEEEKSLIAEETVSEVKEKPKYKNALESKLFEAETLKTISNKLITILRTVKSRIDAPITLNRTVTPLISEIRDEVGKQIDIDLKTIMGGKKDAELQKFMLKHKRYVLENMTTTWLMGANGQGGIPQAIQKQIDGRWISFPNWVGQKIDREKTTTDQAGRTSGSELVRRIPNVFNNVSDADYLGQVIGPDGNPIRGRKESLAKAMSEESAFDIINNDLENEGPIYEALVTNQTRLGYEVMNNFAATFQKDSDRGNSKYSKVFNSFTESQKEYIASKSADLARELANINYSITPDEEDVFNAVQKIYKNGTISIEDLKDLSKDITSYYTPNLALPLKGQSIEYVKNFINASLEENSNKLDRQKTNQLKDASGNAVNSVTQLFNQQEDIRQAQAINSKFIAHLGKKYKGEALNARLRKIGSFSASQAQIGDDSFTINKYNQLVPQTPRVAIDRKTQKEKKKNASDQIYSSKGSFWASAKFALKDVGVVLESGFSRNRKGYIADSAKELYANKNNAEYLKNKKETAIENQNFLYEILDWYYDPENKVPDATKAMLWKSLNSNQQTPLRKAAIAKWIFNENSGPKDFGELRYEHLKSVDKTRAQLHDVFSSNLSENERKDQFANVMEDFNVAVIPVSMDKEIGTLGFKTIGIAGDLSEGARYYNIVTVGNKKLYSLINLDPNAEIKTLGDGFVRFSKLYNQQNNNNIDATVRSLSKDSKVAKPISVFDFDDTVGLTKSNVLYTMPDGTTGKLNGAEFAKQGSTLLEDGAIFDFSEFSKVVDGKPGPMVEKMKKMIAKFGPENFFILTARPANSAEPIHQFLSSIGIDIPLENITGLGNSSAQAKADWMTAKAVEGYNDFYFADDHLPNVEAVQNALNVLDVKSKIQQAREKFSKVISPTFNRIIEENKGTERYKIFSDIVAKRRGASKNLFDLYVPASAADFELLLYNFIGKGSIGEGHKKFFTDALLKPYANGNDLMDAARQSIKKDYKALTDSFPNIKKKIEKLTPDGDFTYDQAIRVAMWTEAGIEIPGISKRDANKLAALVANDPELDSFKNGLIVMGRQGAGWITPTQHWDADTIIADLHNITQGEGRKKFLAEFIENSEEMFGKFENGKLVGANINKVEAIYGTDVREAIEDVLYRMINGKNRGFGQDKETTAWSNWVNGSTGSIMFLNTRSATLQLIGAVNFLNLRDNNPIAAGVAFANQKQYWSDFARIWNSDKMKERRGGLKEDVASAEIANAAATSKNKPAAVIAYLLKIGYTPTQLADSFAIASGGAPFYRNRIKSYLKEGLTESEAETAAWSDFTKVSDETQQSGDPRDISKQQASGAGRLLLTFQNTAMQQSRTVKKSFLDLKNGRGDAKTHVAKIIYYLAIQNTLFAALQQGLFAVAFDDDDKELDPEKDKAKKKTTNERLIGVADGVLDTILRGTGFLGGIVSVLKNMVNKYLDEKDKNFKADYAKVMLEGANISPPIGSKLRKVYTGLQQTKFEKDLIAERGWGITQDGRVHLGPMYGVTGKFVEAGTNFPMDRLVNKIENVSQAMNSQNKAWQRVAVGVGFTPYSVGIEDTKGDEEIRSKAKAIRKKEGIEKGIISREENRKALKDSISKLPYDEQIKIKEEARAKRRESRRKKREMAKY